MNDIWEQFRGWWLDYHTGKTKQVLGSLGDSLVDDHGLLGTTTDMVE